MSMNLRQIEVFRAVMITGSISGASQLLFVSQPAVSRLLSHTESRVGFALFERIKGRLYATPEAKKLFREVEQVYAGVLRVNELARELGEHREGILNVVSSPSVGQMVIPQAMATFRHSHPQVKLGFQFLGYAPLVERLLNHQADLGVTILPVEHPNLDTTPLGSGRLVCICPYNHPLTPRDPGRGRPAGLSAGGLRPWLAVRRAGHGLVRGPWAGLPHGHRGRLAAKRLRLGAGRRRHRAGGRVFSAQLARKPVGGAPPARGARPARQPGAFALRTAVANRADLRGRAA